MRYFVVGIVTVACVVLFQLGCYHSKHRPIDVYLTVESEYGSPVPPVGSNYLNYGMVITASVGSPVEGPAGTRYLCTGWSGTGSVPTNGSTNSVTFVITENSSISWLWKTQYELTTSVLPAEGGTISCSPEGPWHDVDTSVQLEAVANPGYWFLNWSGDLSSSNNPEWLVMDSPKSVTANFTDLVPRTVTVTSAYGEPNPPVGATVYPDGYSVTLSCGPTPYPVGATGTRYVYTGWTGGSGDIPATGTATSYTFTITRNCTITWTWKTQYYLIVVSPYGNPQGGGWYNSGAIAHWSVTSPYAGGTGIQYVTSPTSGNVVMDLPRTVTVNWTTQYELVTTASPSAGGTITRSPGAAWYNSGTVVRLTAVANTGYLFINWSGNLSGTTNPQNLTMNGPKSVTANFAVAPPVAYFAGTPNSGNVPLTVQFTDASTGNITSWFWNFGSGATPATADTQGPHSVTYSTEGWKTVSLTVTGPGGSDTTTKIDYINVLPPAPVADFTATPTSGPAPLTVQFTDTSTGFITSWVWDFDWVWFDDEDSYDQNPSYTYTSAGVYAVKLTVRGPGGTDSATKTDYDYIRVYAGTIYVDRSRTDDTGNGLTWATAKKYIQSGINAASSGWLVLVANGTYMGASNMNLDFAGKAIHLKSVGGAANCTIDCQGSGRGFCFQSMETQDSILDGFTITNGYSWGASGGGIYCSGASPLIINCRIKGNQAGFSGYEGPAYGGGISCVGSSSTIRNCQILGNCARSFSQVYEEYNAYGGGIYFVGGNLTIITCEITNNTVMGVGLQSYFPSYGAGIYCKDGNLIIVNSTIAGNSASFPGSGGGIYCTASTPQAVNCDNTVLWGNSAGSGNQLHSSSGYTITMNYDNCANGSGDISGNGAVTFNNCIYLDPLFVDAANGDYHLQATSPCIDTGSDALVPAGITTDLDGNGRIVDGNNDGTATVDIGAYEYQP